VHVVDIGGTRIWRDRLGNLVGVVGGGQAGADVKELADASLTGQVGDRAGKERPGGARVLHDRREGRKDLIADGPVGGGVVLAAQPVAPDPGRLRHRGVDVDVDVELWRLRLAVVGELPAMGCLFPSLGVRAAIVGLSAMAAAGNRPAMAHRAGG
jgi:hypothetical protein